MRLRTLPLSFAGASLGILLAYSDYKIDWMVAGLIVLTSFLLQILSNLANELGDVQNGTDSAERLGPKYGLNGGELTETDMKILIVVMILSSIASGLSMIYLSFGSLLKMESVCMIMLGFSSIVSSLRYTLGKNPYGYRAMGDLFVFLYFGIISVLGAYFIVAHDIPNIWLVLPATAVGLFCVGVLNINNMRDMESDMKTKKTVAILMGLKGARIYQTFLIAGGWISMISFCLLRFYDIRHYLYFASLPLFVLSLHTTWADDGKKIDKALPILSAGTCLFAILSGIGFTLFLSD